MKESSLFLRSGLNKSFAFLQNKGFPPKTKQEEAQPTHIGLFTRRELAVPLLDDKDFGLVS